MVHSFRVYTVTLGLSVGHRNTLWYHYGPKLWSIHSGFTLLPWDCLLDIVTRYGTIMVLSYGPFIQGLHCYLGTVVGHRNTLWYHYGPKLWSIHSGFTLLPWDCLLDIVTHYGTIMVLSYGPFIQGLHCYLGTVCWTS